MTGSRRAPVFGPPVQVAYVVSDPEEAAHDWARQLGAGPFFVARHIPVTDVVHRGRPSSFDHTSAYGWWGSVMVELLTQHDDAPSAVWDRFAPGEHGLHHLACFVDHLDDALRQAEAIGWPVAMTASAGATRFAFVDAVATHGHFWELYEPSGPLVDFYRMVESAHRDGDGGRPVRELGA